MVTVNPQRNVLRPKTRGNKSKRKKGAILLLVILSFISIYNSFTLMSPIAGEMKQGYAEHHSNNGEVAQAEATMEVEFKDDDGTSVISEEILLANHEELEQIEETVEDDDKNDNAFEEDIAVDEEPMALEESKEDGAEDDFVNFDKIIEADEVDVIEAGAEPDDDGVDEIIVADEVDAIEAEAQTNPKGYDEAKLQIEASDEEVKVKAEPEPESQTSLANCMARLLNREGAELCSLSMDNLSNWIIGTRVEDANISEEDIMEPTDDIEVKLDPRKP